MSREDTGLVGVDLDNLSPALIFFLIGAATINVQWWRLPDVVSWYAFPPKARISTRILSNKIPKKIRRLKKCIDTSIMA